MPHFLSGRWLWPGIALLVGIAGMSAVWVAASVLSGTSCSWLGLLAAIDMVLLLRLTHAPEGTGRVLAAVGATLATIFASQWLVVATQLGVALGMPPMASAVHLGPHLAWQLGSLTLGRVDWVLLGAAPVLAAILAPGKAAPDKAAPGNLAQGNAAPGAGGAPSARRPPT